MLSERPSLETTEPGLRVMIYDQTCAGPTGVLPGLSASWRLGGWLYGRLGRLDRWRAARTWEDALTWLAEVEPHRAIDEIQYWGHGNWGSVRLAGEVLDIEALHEGHRHHRTLQRIRHRLHPKSLWWFRTCETFGRTEGQAFARAWTRFFGCRAAGHTYVIGPTQSGLHTLGPDDEPDWPVGEGLAQDRSDRALWSRWRAPNTITCLHGRIPEGW